MPGKGEIGGAIGGAIAGLFVAAFGLFWTVSAFEDTRGSPFPLSHSVFPFFGLIFVFAGIAIAIASIVAASNVPTVGTLQTPPDDPARTNDQPNVKPGSLVQCECGEPFRVGGKFCTRCGKPTPGTNS